MSDDHIPLISLSKRIVDPIIIIGTLYLSCATYRETFTSYYLVLGMLASFISTAINQCVNPYRNWRRGPLLPYAIDIISGWGITSLALVNIGDSSNVADHFEMRTMIAWLVSTPLIQLVSHRTMQYMTINAAIADTIRSVVVIGANEAGLKLADICEEQPHLAMRMHGYFDDRNGDRRPPNLSHPVLGGIDDIVPYVQDRKIKLIFISQPISSQPRIRKLTDELQDTIASVYFLPDVSKFQLTPVGIGNVGGVRVIGICETPILGFNAAVKRASDIALAAIIILGMSPLMLSIAFAVRMSSRGPVIFRQLRYGLHGEEIVIYKFRSMKVQDNSPSIVQAKMNDQRLTPIGSFLRRSSLDELPQFLNVLQGRMSIVGPRPHAVAHNEEYRKQIKGYMLRHKVKPGITGWAQVNGLRGETATLDKMEARVAYDIDYLRNWSLWLDLWIIIKTIGVVVRRNNAY